MTDGTPGRGTGPCETGCERSNSTRPAKSSDTLASQATQGGDARGTRTIKGPGLPEGGQGAEWPHRQETIDS